MASVHIPTPMRVATDGAARVQIAGATVREVVDCLEEQFPDLGSRLVEDGQLRPGLAVFVDGANSRPATAHQAPAGQRSCSSWSPSAAARR